MGISSAVILSLAFGFFFALSGVAHAQTGAPAHFGVAGRVSTLGIGVDFAVPVTEHANFRVAFNGLGRAGIPRTTASISPSD